MVKFKTPNSATLKLARRARAGSAEASAYGKLISQRKDDGGIWVALYLHFDALGSTVALTDDMEVVTDTYLYRPFGEVTPLTGTTGNVYT